MGFSDKQKQILKFPYMGKTALICDGAIRSGKTSIMSLSFILWAMGSFSGCSFGICGKTVISAERNVIKPLLGIKYLREHFIVRFTNHILTVSKGERTNTFYVFGGKDESSYQLIQGITLAGVLLDEVALMPESFVNQALARCSVEGSKFWFNCNPEHPEHWFYKEWILGAEKHDAMHLHFQLDDNPSLSEKIKQRYHNSYTGVFYDRYILGRWVIAEGLVYPMFDKELHTYKAEPQERGRWYVSIDYGTVNPFSAGLWYATKDKAYRVAEYYWDSRSKGGQKTDEEYYTALEKLLAGKSIEYIVIDPSAASFIECIRRHGRYRVKQAVNDVVDGIRVTSTLLKGGCLLLHESCKDSIREFSMYSWDNKANDDKPIKEYDHAMDDIRYFCNTVLQREFRWIDWGR